MLEASKPIMQASSLLHIFTHIFATCLKSHASYGERVREGRGGREKRHTDRDRETCYRLLQRRYFGTSKSRELEALSPFAAEEPCLNWISLD